MIQLLSNYENIIIRTRSFRALNEIFRKITYTSLALLEIKKKQKMDICAVISIAKLTDGDRTKNHSKK